MKAGRRARRPVPCVSVAGATLADVAGRIRETDIAVVRERSPIAEVVGEHLQLRRAGSTLKGLCPFHEERSPSFNVNPDRGFFHCFGCGEGGDVISFVQKVESLSFPEAVESLARRAGVPLTYEQGSAAPRDQQGQRARLLAAHAEAQALYADALRTLPQAEPARAFLAGRGFDAAAVAMFGCGFAPAGWDTLVRHLTAQGFSGAELETAGLASPGRRGPVDRFRGRLTWPIRDVRGEVIGFGARRLGDEDGPKYLNSPETPLYRKSAVLYGLDLAKKEIGRRRQAVVVEGYTDVMACHLAGVSTAVATCGTAFGAEHIRVLRTRMLDQDEFRGEVVFTFDGDEAGQRAARRAFEDDQQFVAQTFVAVEPHGLDPCDLRLRAGDAAVRDLVARRVPLFEFAIRSLLADYDLDSIEGREAALRAAVPVVARIKDRGLRDPYAARLAGWVGALNVDAVVNRVREAAGDATRRAHPGRGRPAPPRRDDPALLVEREVLKLAVQHPVLVGPAYDGVDPAALTAPAYVAAHKVVQAAGGVAAAGAGGPAWVGLLRDHAPDDTTRSLLTELAVEPPRTEEVDRRYAEAQLAALRTLHLERLIGAAKSRLQRLNPVEVPEDYNRLFGELIALEQERRALREREAGAA